MSPYYSLFRKLSRVYKGLRKQVPPDSWASVGLGGAIMLGMPDARESFVKALARASKGRTELAVGVSEVNTPVMVPSIHPMALVGCAGSGKSMLSNFFAMQYLANQFSVLCLDVVAGVEFHNRLKIFCEEMPFEYTPYAVTAENLTQGIPLPLPAEVVCVSTDVLLNQNSQQRQVVCAALLGSLDTLCLYQAAVPAKNRIPALVVIRDLDYLLNSQENLNTVTRFLAQARSLNIQVVVESQGACRYICNLDAQELWVHVGTFCVFRSPARSEYLPAVGAEVFKNAQWLQVGQCRVLRLPHLQDFPPSSTGVLTQVPFFNFSS